MTYDLLLGLGPFSPREALEARLDELRLGRDGLPEPEDPPGLGDLILRTSLSIAIDTLESWLGASGGDSGGEGPPTDLDLDRGTLRLIRGDE